MDSKFSVLVIPITFESPLKHIKVCKAFQAWYMYTRKCKNKCPCSLGLSSKILNSFSGVQWPVGCLGGHRAVLTGLLCSRSEQ